MKSKISISKATAIEVLATVVVAGAVEGVAAYANYRREHPKEKSNNKKRFPWSRSKSDRRTVLCPVIEQNKEDDAVTEKNNQRQVDGLKK